MSEKRFRKLLGFIQDNTCEKGDVEGVMDLTEIEDMLNEQQATISQLKEENEQLKKLIERKDILLKTRTEYIEDRIQSFNDFISYMDTFLYKSDVDPNDVKQDIMNILQKWEIKKRECCR